MNRSSYGNYECASESIAELHNASSDALVAYREFVRLPELSSLLSQELTYFVDPQLLPSYFSDVYIPLREVEEWVSPRHFEIFMEEQWREAEEDGFDEELKPMP